MPDVAIRRGWTPRELGRLLRVAPCRIRRWIERGELGAINTAAAYCGRPRYVILPHHLQAFAQSRQGAKPKPTPRRRRQSELEDFYPD